MKSHRTRVVAGGVALLAVTGVGAAVAGTGALSPNEESEAILNDVADELDVTPRALTEALENALGKRVDAAVAAGRLTEEEGEALMERIQAGDLPLLGGPLSRGGGHFGGLEAAAAYLDLTEVELRTAIREGETLADVAEERGKSVDGLIDAMVNAATERLDEAVADGRLTAAEREAMLADLEARITGFVNGTAGPRPGGGPGFFAGPPSEAA